MQGVPVNNEVPTTRRTSNRVVSLLATAAMVGGIVLPVSFASAVVAAPAPAAAVEPAFRVLVFSYTQGFRHSSIASSNAAIQSMATANNFAATFTEDPAAFNSSNAATLATYDAVIFNSTTGDLLNAGQQATFESYIRAGGGFAGIHAASDAEYDWAWYNQLVGGYFNTHPANQNATIKINDRVNESTKHLTGDTWTRFDEWYNYRSFQADKVHVLLSLVESSYSGGTNGVEHPIAWCQEFDGGRSWYTGMGHTEASYTEPGFVSHLLGGIKIAAGVVPSGCSATQSGNFEKVTLDENTDNPMALDIVQSGAEKGTVFYLERDGRVQRLAAGTNAKTTALTLGVTLGNEDGLLGLVLDPAFATNGHAFFYWSPASVTTADGPHNRISRFTYNFTTKVFNPASEIAVLKITTQRQECCHAGGDMLFDNAGNLILATGDNANPFASDGYTPIDERAGRSNWDAQGTSGNSNDLRGKVLRITPTTAGGYTIPAGNLFAESADTTNKTRPEIYAMGFRNPFRIGLDPFTGSILVGDYGPDAGSANASRGPGGTVEWNIVDEPGNYGWPYCVGVKCYNDFNFATATSGAVFSAAGPTNNSPNNTGLTTLPAVKAPEIWMENGLNPTNVPEIGASGAPMGGPVYDFDPALSSTTKWPEFWEGRALFGEWNQGKMYSFQLNRAGAGAAGSRVVDIDRTMPGIFDPAIANPFYRTMDFEFGPDGALYAADWGSGFSGSSGNSGIYRIDYIKGNPSPIARAGSNISNGPTAPLTVVFNSTGTSHPLGKAFTVRWDFKDGTFSTAANPTHVFTANGQYNVTMTVTDVDARTAVATVPIVVGNAVPVVTIQFPQNGGFFNWGDQVAYTVTVNDPDAGGPIDCSRVQVLPALGHSSHQHPMEELSGCQGTIQTARDSGHGLEAELFWVVDVRYLDNGGAAGVPLTGYGLNVLNSKHLEAEYFDTTGRIGGTGGTSDGVVRETTGDSAGGGQNLGYIEPNDWWAYEPVNLVGLNSITMRLAKGFSGNGSIDVRWNSPTGPTIATVPFTPTLVGGVPQWQTYSNFTATLAANRPTGTGTLYFVLTQGGVNVNSMDFGGNGLTTNQRPVVTLSASPASGTAPVVVSASAVATDPDAAVGDGPLTYKWNAGQGAGFVAGSASQQFTYSTSGQYTLTVRATDSRGAYSDASTTITVTDPSAGCVSGRSDSFGGSALDTTRWNRSVRLNQQPTVANGLLTIPAARSEIYGAGGDTPNIVLQDMPTGAFTATAKVSFAGLLQYQQAGIVVYSGDDNYIKLVRMARGTSPDANNRVFQLLKEVGASPTDFNTANLGAAFPDTYYVRFVSDGATLTGSYSADGVAFTTVGSFALAGLVSPKIGLLALGSTSAVTATTPVINAQYDWFTVTPEAAVSPNDEFAGTALETCRWTVVNSQPTGYRVTGGSLEIDTSAGDIYGGDTTGVSNFIVQAQPSANWTVETRVDGSAFDRAYQQGGIILYGDNDNYVKLDLVSTNTAGSTVARNLELRSETGGVVSSVQPTAPAPASGIVWLRLQKAGTTLTAFYSLDGANWTPFSQTVSNSALGTARVGIYALGNSAQGLVSRTAKFDYFRVV